MARLVPTLSPGKIFDLLRGGAKRGGEPTHRDRQLLAEIGKWSWPYWGEAPATVPVHVLTSANDWLGAAWMLASFFHYSELAWPVVIHDDGTLPAEAGETLTRLFENVRIIPRAVADAEMSVLMMAYPFCAPFRQTHPLALKTFDMAHFADGDRFIVLDSDVLFFKKPREIIEWATGDLAECWFNQDTVENSLISAADARDDLGVKLWPRVNTGVCLLWKSAIDLDFCDSALAQTSITNGAPHRIERTLLALCASKHNRGGSLPDRYEVSPARAIADEAVSRHYTGDARELFFSEGLKRLHEPLIEIEPP